MFNRCLLGFTTLHIHSLMAEVVVQGASCLSRLIQCFLSKAMAIVQCLGARNWTSDPPITRLATQPPEPLPFRIHITQQSSQAKETTSCCFSGLFLCTGCTVLKAAQMSVTFLSALIWILININESRLQGLSIEHAKHLTISPSDPLPTSTVTMESVKSCCRVYCLW